MYKFNHIHSVSHTYMMLQLTIILLPQRNMDFTNNENSILVYLPANLATRYHLHNWHEYSETAQIKTNIHEC
jgi:hypothetical protein